MHDISKKEMERRIALAQSAKAVILNTMPVEEETDSGLVMAYRDFYMQVDFTFLHPLMVVTLLRKLEKPTAQQLQRQVNDLNLQSIIGCHTVSANAGVYSYRAAHWLDIELTKERFLEMLDRCFDEAQKIFDHI